MVALESTALSLAKMIVQKAAGAWIADRRTAEVSKKELRALLTPWFRRESPEQRFLDEAASDLASFSHEFRGLDDGERAAALLAVHDAFTRVDLTDRALFAVDVDAAKLASRLRAGQPRAKIIAGLGEAGGAFYDAALDRCCVLYVRAVVQVPTFVGRSSSEILKRVSDLPDRVADRLSDLPNQVVNALREVQAVVADPDGGVTVAGRPLAEVTDPFVLEVHRPVQPEDAPPGLPVLPPYVPREHDQVLGQVVRAAVDGRSGIVVLVGGSSTGKTRACWEALALLRDQDPPWRLWHPIDPSRPDAALAELPGIGPRTVVWLNEAQFYLDPADGLGEQVAAGLRELLRDPARGPVLVLATLWPEYWHSLTARPAGGEDRHAQVRELLAGHDITVPAAFTPAQMGQLAQAADVRMTLAARSAPDGAVIQFLAGAPELLARYRNAPPAAAALIEAAMDARRLGMGSGPAAGLPGSRRAGIPDRRPVGRPRRGLAGTGPGLHRRPVQGRPRAADPHPPPPGPGRRPPRGDQPASMAAAGPLYRLADYLDQHGRAHRASQVPPAEFWSAAAAHAAPGDQAALGDAAHDHGLYRDAAQLHKNAAASGNLPAVFYLSRPPDCLRADLRPAHWAVAHVVLDDPHAVAVLLDRLREAGADEQAAALLARDPAAHAALDDPSAVAVLLDRLLLAGADEQAAALASRAAAHVPLDDPADMAFLLRELRDAGADQQAAALLARDPAAHVPLDNPHGLAWLLDMLREADEQAAALLARDPAAHVPLDNPGDVASLLRALRDAGADEQAAALASRAAAYAPLDDPDAVAGLLRELRDAGADEQAAALLARDPAAHVPLDNPHAVAGLLRELRAAGADEQAAALASRAAAYAPLDNLGAVASLLRELRDADADEQAAALLARDPAAHVPLDNPHAVAFLLRALRDADADEQAAALASRAAAHAPLDDPGAVAGLLRALRDADADEQAAALASRAAAYAPLDDPGAVAGLLRELRDADADEQAAALASRASAAGMFALFPERGGLADQFRFGREADGTPAAPWGWEDLDLWPKRRTEFEQPRRHPAV